MSDDMAKPISKLPNCFGQTVPIYGLTYDKHGTCTSPKTRDDLVDRIDADGFTDVIFYSHGWNNEYTVAKERYETFLRGLSDTNSAHSAGIGAGFKPLFIGVFWPSTILVWPSDRTPDIAAESDDGPLGTEFDRDDLADTLALLAPDEAGLLENRLNAGERLTVAEATNLAAAFAEAMPVKDDDDLAVSDANMVLEAEDIMAAWQRISGTDKRPDTEGSAVNFGLGDETASPDAEVAGLLGFDPRIIVRATTMWKMKDRAGVVGVNGVSGTLGRLMNGSQARFHLVGHSYGCKVVTSALVSAGITRKAHSLTLLQPAINHLAFAPEADAGRPGAFRAAFDRLEKPILSTFSWQDIPLYRMFHLAARRKKDVGELQFAARKVNRYYGLGGYGPQVFTAGEVMGLKLPRTGNPFPTPPSSVRLIGLDGAEGITGHSDVNNDYTFWAMLQQLA